MRWRAVLIGFGLGTLTVAVVSLLVWLALSALDVEDPVLAATTVGMLSGFVAAGWLAGGRAPFSEWYHGAVAAMGIALVVVVTSIRSGSTAPTSQVLLVAALAIVFGGIGGFLGGRRTSGE